MIKKSINLYKLLLAGMLAAVCVWYIKSNFNWNELVGRIEKAEYDWLLLGSGCAYLGFLIARTWRWKILVSQIDPGANLRALYLPTAIIVSISSITPGQLGETFKVELLRRGHRADTATAVGFFLVERAIDLLIILSCGLVSALLIPYKLFDVNSSSLFMVSLAGILAGLLVIRYFTSHQRFRAVSKRFLLTLENPIILAKVSSLSIIAWLFIAIAWQIALASIGINLSLASTIVVMSLTMLSVLLSFIPTGIGVAEVVISQLLMVENVGETQAQAGALILRLASIWWLVIGLVHLAIWWFKSLADHRSDKQ